MPDRTVVGERLKKLRGSRTQGEVAEALGVTPMAVSQWENGLRMPSDDMTPLSGSPLSVLKRGSFRSTWYWPR